MITCLLLVDTSTNQVDEREPVSNQLLPVCTGCKQADSQVEVSQPSVVVPNQFVHYTLRCRDQLSYLPQSLVDMKHSVIWYLVTNPASRKRLPQTPGAGGEAHCTGR